MNWEKPIWVRKPTAQQKKLLESQPTWEHVEETWPAHYDERCETFLVIEGEGYITDTDGNQYAFVPGDLVSCKPDMDCTWTVTKHIKKHYIFNMDLS